MIRQSGPRSVEFKTRVLRGLLFLGLASLCRVGAVGGPLALAAQVEAAQKSWHQEFQIVCGKTDEAMTLSQEQLTNLIRRCDALEPRIEKLNETQKKVYLERLRKCRGLYVYVLDAKEKEKK